MKFFLPWCAFIIIYCNGKTRAQNENHPVSEATATAAAAETTYRIILVAMGPLWKIKCQREVKQRIVI